FDSEVLMQIMNKTNTEVAEETLQRELRPKPGMRKYGVLGVIALVMLAGSLLFGILPRVKARASLRSDIEQMSVVTVSVVHPERSAPSQEIVLPASVQAYSSAPIYARTNGYLKRWYVDIGARVRKGQLLAEIETPELDQQLQQARAQLAT